MDINIMKTTQCRLISNLWRIVIVPFLIISDITADLDASTLILKMVTGAVSHSIHMSI
jgi:hypothetical protein